MKDHTFLKSPYRTSFRAEGLPITSTRSKATVKAKKERDEKRAMKAAAKRLAARRARCQRRIELIKNQ